MLNKKINFFIGDKVILFVPFLLSIFGIIVIFNISPAAATANLGNKLYYFNRQLISFAIGTTAFIFFSFFDYKLLKKISLPIFFINVIFLILVLIPGFGREVYGGRRWLQLGFFGFQPAEALKLSLVIYLATLFEKKKHFIPFLFLLTVLLLLVMLEPDFGTAIIITSTAMILYFISGAPIREFFAIIFLGLLTAPFLIFFSPYRKERFLSFLHSSNNVNLEKTSYHAKQILIALGSGGLFGRGFGQSRQKFLFLPEVTTDSVFAVIGEEFGFLGSFFLISMFLLLIVKGFQTAMKTTDPFAKMLVCGIIFFFSLQTIINMSSVVSLIPITGVPLPLISYGGSSMITTLAGMGIVYNVSRGQRGG